MSTESHARVVGWRGYLYADEDQAGDEVDLLGQFARTSSELFNRQAVVAERQGYAVVAAFQAAVGILLMISGQGH